MPVGAELAHSIIWQILAKCVLRTSINLFNAHFHFKLVSIIGTLINPENLYGYCTTCLSFEVTNI